MKLGGAPRAELLVLVRPMSPGRSVLPVFIRFLLTPGATIIGLYSRMPA
jgi:hypothetical protein